MLRRVIGTVTRRSSWRRSTALGTLAAAAAFLGLGVFAPMAFATSEAAIRDAGTNAVVPDSYVVALKAPGSHGADSRARELAARYNGRVGHVYSRALQGFEVTLSESQARRLAADPAVDYVQRNGIIEAADVQTNPPSWGLDRIDQRTLPLDQSYTYPNSASNVHAYVIDTGILFSHTTFGGRATSGRDTIDNDNDATDCHGHGTHVAGTIGGVEYGVAKGVSLVGVRVLNCAGSGSTASVVAGIDWVTANAVKPAVANMSLGGGTDPILDNAVRNSIASGVTYAIAAGNSNSSACTASPARVAEAITVGATDSADKRATFSNHGSCLDLFAPGVGIKSAWHTSVTATNTISGTSMATPHVAGAAALVLGANPGYSPQQVRDAIVTKATKGIITNAGTKSPNALLYVGDAAQPPPPCGRPRCKP